MSSFFGVDLKLEIGCSLILAIQVFSCTEVILLNFTTLSFAGFGGADFGHFGVELNKIEPMNQNKNSYKDQNK